MAGLSLALVLSWVLSPIRQRWIHVGAFFAVPILVLAIPFLAEPGNGLAPLCLGAVLGLSCAAGRAAIICNATIVDPATSNAANTEPAKSNHERIRADPPGQRPRWDRGYYAGVPQGAAAPARHDGRREVTYIYQTLGLGAFAPPFGSMTQQPEPWE